MVRAIFTTNAEASVSAHSISHSKARANSFYGSRRFPVRSSRDGTWKVNKHAGLGLAHKYSLHAMPLLGYIVSFRVFTKLPTFLLVVRLAFKIIIAKFGLDRTKFDSSPSPQPPFFHVFEVMFLPLEGVVYGRQ